MFASDLEQSNQLSQKSNEVKLKQINHERWQIDV